jgi:hypothetical protein
LSYSILSKCCAGACAVKKRRHFRLLVSIAPIIGFVLVSISIWPISVRGSSRRNGNTTSVTKQSETAKPDTAKMATAREGVQLLQEIFQRLHNAPQIALAKSKQLIAFQPASSLPPPAFGSTDSDLLIKPAASPRGDSGRPRFDFAPNLPPVTDFGMPYGKLLPQKNIAVAPSMAGPAVEALKVKGEQTDALQQTDASLDSITSKRARVIWEQGNQRYNVPALAREKAAESGEPEETSQAKVVSTYTGLQDQSGQVVSNAPLIKEFKTQANGTTYSGNPASSTAARHGGLVANGTFDLNDAIRRANSPQFKKLARGLAGANLPKLSQVHIQAQAELSATGGYAAKPVENNKNAALQSTQATSPGLGGVNNETVGPMAAINSITMSNGGTEFSISSPASTASPQVATSVKRDVAKPRSKSLKKSTDRQELAYLPLTKFAGIPLVSLGDKESDLPNRLKFLGAVEKTLVKPWSVWSLTRPGSDDYSLQVFAQNGIVDAVRVKDSSLWSSEPGIFLGDAVSAVKEKFGEPAFILCHSRSSEYKVYVYPISQVAFRLERSSDADMPRVKDVIIFNVK